MKLSKLKRQTAECFFKLTLNNRMKMKHCIFLNIIVIIMFSFTSISQNQDLNKVSEKLLLATKMGDQKAIDTALSILKKIELNQIIDDLDSDDKKKAFWINVYNSYIIIKLAEDSTLYENRREFFSAKNIKIANENFSFDFIEHGILRRSKVKLSLGFFGKLFPSKLERQLRVNKLDYRIHFALNCGATSCPPVAFYEAKKIDDQLDIAEAGFVLDKTTYDEESNTANTPAIFSWFRADFEGKRGIRKIIRKHMKIENKKFNLKFDKYDWGVDINNFEEK